jgi:hypothetical protein
MLKGLAITPPVVGRITIGRIVEKNGKRLPEKDDQFTITSQMQHASGWLLHPLNESLRKATTGKLRSIPVRMLFNDPDLNLRAEYSLGCPTPDGCAFGESGGCKPYGRLNVTIGDEDELGSFIFRTTSFNSIRTLSARLHYFSAVSDGLLACLPLELKLRGKSTTQSFRTAIYYVDLGVRAGSSLEEAIVQARELDARRKAAGFNQAALDAAARAGFANGAFEDSPDERAAIAEEFYPDTGSDHQGATQGATDGGTASTSAPASTTLRDKLERKTVLLGGAAA